MRALLLCGLLAAFVIGSAALPASAATWHIFADGSGDFPTIAAAVAAASTNDSILVYAGTYNEWNIEVTKRLFIVGVAGADATIIDAGYHGRCFLFRRYTSSQILLQGFTLQNGGGLGAAVLPGFGGAVICSGSSKVRMIGCTFSENLANLGGAVCVRDTSAVTIRHCHFYRNDAWPDSYPGTGGAIYLTSALGQIAASIDTCSFVQNDADSDGGAIYAFACDVLISGCTFYQNYCLPSGATISLMDAGIELETSIVTLSQGYGVIAYLSLPAASFSCNDFYNNASGNYGGLISDQTGTNNNISANAIFCGAPSDLSISTTSPCAAANSGCGQTIGRYGPACGPNLKFSFVWFTSYHPWLGTTTTGMVRVRNVGNFSAGPFYIDYYENSATPPAPGAHGDQRHLVAGLAAGDSISWETSPVTNDQLAEWQSYFRVDTDAMVPETNEGDNLTGAQTILWIFPPEGAYPWGVGAAFNSSPVIAPIDENLSTQEIAIGCDNGNLYVFDWFGSAIPGFPVTLGGPVRSSPAVGNVAGNFWNEIVVGCDDGRLYVFDRRGALLWNYQTESAIRTTPSLVDLTGDDHLEIVLATGSYLYALDGRGEPIKGWPYKEDVTFMGTAVGDVDGDGAPEIAAVARVGESVTRIYLFEANGELHAGSWPVQLDAVPAAGPAIGDITTSAGLEIVVASTAGRVYVITTGGTVWGTVPQVTGSIGSAPIIEDVDKNGHLDIVVTSKIWALGGSPPVMRWNGYVTAIDRNGAVVSGWPQAAGGWASDVGPVASATALGTQADVFSTSPPGYLYAWRGTGVRVPTFPYGLPASVLGSSAAGDVDGDGWTELFVASTSGAIYGYKMQVGGYGEGTLWWPMYGHDPARTFCYGFVVPTEVDGGASTPPAVTALGAIYPNPFNPTTRIAFDTSAKGHVEIAIYDVSGRMVAVLVDREMEAGRHEAFWNGKTTGGRTAASGIYFCTLRAGSVSETKKLVLLR